jgi:hypothetical protein
MARKSIYELRAIKEQSKRLIAQSRLVLEQSRHLEAGSRCWPNEGQDVEPMVEAAGEGLEDFKEELHEARVFPASRAYRRAKRPTSIGSNK